MSCPHCGRAYPPAFAKILVAFETGEPISQYQLSKKLDLSYRQVLRIVHHLKSTKYIEVDHTERSSKGGKDQIFWRRIHELS